MALNGSMRGATAKPMSVQEISKKAETFEYDSSVPLKYWLRTATLLLREASIYEREGNDQQAYLLLFRHANLVLGHLTKHPDASKRENRPGLEQLERSIPHVLDKLGDLKPRITRQYERYQKAMKDREARRASQTTDSTHNEFAHHRNSGAARRAPSDPAIAGASTTLNAGENRELAVRLAQKEIRRRETARRSTRQAGISEAEEHERRTGGVWGDWEEALADDGDSQGDDLQRRMHNVHHRVQEPHSQGRRNGAIDDSVRSESRSLKTGVSTSGYAYPQVPKREEQRFEDRMPESLSKSASIQYPTRGILKPSRPPELPRKERLDDGQEDDLNLPLQGVDLLPPRPEKSPLSSPPSSDPISRSSTDTPTSSDLHPSTFTFKPSAYLENGSPLRTIFLPPDLRSMFLRIAEPNTRANLETCGILCGTLISNALFISRLVIPEQESTSDTCETVNESALFDYCDNEDLMVLGWIHTHPSQTCFMSSRDLHTHCGYQVMMPESIAIVCAPSKNPSWGVFRLTDPPGMKTVRNCTKPGLFHPHEESNVYTDALRPGHVFEASGMEFQVVDLRPDH
ncbi:MAG: hypothetical protein M4579_006562 [Chaenotheca gracillima]|nr:MAG: hypothetical protein M4579_006562 [Chaenotheca gracillima]